MSDDSQQAAQWMSAKQVAAWLGLPLDTVYLYARDGRLPSRRFPGGRRVMFRRDELLRRMDQPDMFTS